MEREQMGGVDLGGKGRGGSARVCLKLCPSGIDFPLFDFPHSLPAHRLPHLLHLGPDALNGCLSPLPSPEGEVNSNLNSAGVTVT